MPTLKELHDKLEAISAKVESARQQMDFKRGLNDGHNLSSGELLARYKFLKDKLDEEVTELDAHARHVSALEQDTRNWINSIDLGAS
ncbi:hypothetical protein SAMN05444414_1643 [Roseovarius marisflavi]|uniref:Uncharacterized protein n=1 Tax=Roseovarius marisflavi TaxID=1054996 RepID=A0A1M7E0T6_9RHOB|nr:hypothetical protein [Roseovarius marisflavi]SHL85283.1 hypothetical protein SAMN05444414_1643 [Roseovarius marisflavi]